MKKENKATNSYWFVPVILLLLLSTFFLFNSNVKRAEQIEEMQDVIERQDRTIESRERSAENWEDKAVQCFASEGIKDVQVLGIHSQGEAVMGAYEDELGNVYSRISRSWRVHLQFAGDTEYLDYEEIIWEGIDEGNYALYYY